MSSVVISGDSSGTVTLTVPSAAGTNTATLPAATGTVMVSGNQPAFSAFANGGQSLSNSTFTKIQWNNENFDTNNNFDSTTNYRFTPTVAGYYQVNATMVINAMTGQSELAFYKNGSVYLYGPYPNSVTADTPFSALSALIYCNGTTDYIEVYAYQNSGGSKTLNSSGNTTCQFSGCLVRSA